MRIWLALMASSGLFLAACGDSDSEPVELTLGAEVYLQRCIQCHLPTGQGVPRLNPPLDGSPRVNGPPEPLIALVLHGLQGPTTVLGKTYNGVMPAWREVLTAEEIAAVLTHVRSSWGNEAEPVTVEMVHAVAQRTGSRNTFYTIETLPKFKVDQR